MEEWSLCRDQSEKGVALQLKIGGDADRPALALAYLQLGRYYVQTHNPSAALEFLIKAIDINERLERSHNDPTITKLDLYLGSFPRMGATHAFIVLGRITEANDTAERGLELVIRVFGLFNSQSFKSVNCYVSAYMYVPEILTHD